jgi:tRNA threonylcarbamoyladenosine modification (KEOPS) complex  Pcc1 subunit
MVMDRSIKLKIYTPHRDIVYKALKMEIDSAPYKKTTTVLKNDGKFLYVQIDSEDLSALRGTFNSYMNWLKIIMESLEEENPR